MTAITSKLTVSTLALKQKRKKVSATVQFRCMIDARLKTLRVLATTGTIAATADLTGYSASAVSAQIRELQRALDMKLVVRDGRGVRLTATGRHLVTGIDAIMSQWEQLRAESMHAGGQLPANLGLGGFSTAAAHLLAPLVSSLRVTHPKLSVHVMEAQPQRCLELLLAERIDVAVIVASHIEAQPADADRFEQTPLLDDPLDVILPSSHPLAARDSVTLEELAGDDWITDVHGSVYRSLFTAAFTMIGATPRVVHEAVEWETMVAFIGAGMGVGLVPRLASLWQAENVTRLRITGRAKPARRIVAVARKGSMSSPVIRQSLEVLQSNARVILAERLAEEHKTEDELALIENDYQHTSE